jgi:dienelactone hydrolase
LYGGRAMAGEIATLVADATPYVTAAVGAYGGAVLAKVRDDAADATVGVGRRLLQRVFGHRTADEPLPAPLAALAADLDDADALGMVRWAIRQALEADAEMLEEVKSMLSSAQGTVVKQNVRAGRDAYVAGRDMTINRASE